MAKEKVAALVVPESKGLSAERRTYLVEDGGTFPGEWIPGEPQTLVTLGLTPDDARKLIKDNDLPHKFTTAEAPPEDFLDRTAGMVSGAVLDSEPPPAPVGERFLPETMLAPPEEAQPEPGTEKPEGPQTEGKQ